MTSKTEMLMMANHLESRADDAYMEHEDVCMTPREVHALADDIKAFVSESDRPTCHISETDHEFEDSVRCDRCRTTFNRPCEPFKYCPNCGAEVIDD